MRDVVHGTVSLNGRITDVVDDDDDDDDCPTAADAAIGSLCIDSLGRLTRLSDSPHNLLPVNFRFA